MGILGRQFKKLSPTERAIYDEMADADRVRYATEKARYATIIDVLEMELRKNRFTEWHHWNMSSLTNLLVAQMHGFSRGIIG